MAREKSEHVVIEDLEKLASNTEIIPIDLSKEYGKDLLDQYLRTKVKPKGVAPKGVIDLSFNAFLSQHKDFKEFEGKVIVAEITNGSLGYGRDEGIDVDGANFIGCSFKKVEFHSMENVSFRDSVLDGVRIVEGQFSQIDFRGSELSDCEFFSDTGVHSLTNIQLAFANPDKVQDKGVFVIEDAAAVGISIDNIDRKFDQEKSDKIKATIRFYLSKQKPGLLQWAFGGAINPDEWGKSLKKENLPLELQARIESIEQRDKESREAAYEAAHHKLSVRFAQPTCDPTYTPNQAADRAAAIKVPLRATKEDLERYIKSDQKLSFNEFIAEKDFASVAKLQELQKENEGKIIVPVADFFGADISGMDLSGLDLRGVNFSYCNMNKCEFNGTKLNGSCLEGCEIKGAQFKKANLMDCNMIGVTADEHTSFKEANMIRARVNASELRGVNLDGAVGYLANFRGSDMERASMTRVGKVRADMRRANFEGVNLRYVDAQYANMRRANLSNAVADDAKLMHANFTYAIAKHFKARKANLEHAEAHGADFSDADLREIMASHADFEGAILRRVDAKLAIFKEAILRDVQGQGADFSQAKMEQVKAERIDISGAVMKYTELKLANLTDAIMQDIDASNADLREAILVRANLRRAGLVAVDLREADLENANVEKANLMAANLEKANVDGLKFDEGTILVDAILRDLAGHDETIKEALLNQQKKQEALEKLFGSSGYGGCSKNEDGSNDRFKCQRLGAAVLSAAMAGGAGVTLAGPMAGLPAAAVASLISDKALLAVRNNYYNDLGYVNNALGDRLAEVGAIAFSMGVGTAGGAINGGVAGLVCSFAGVVNGAALSAVGVGAALGGMNLALKGIKQESGWRRIAGQVLGGVGAVTAFFGFSSLGTSISTVAYGAALGGITGGLWAAETSRIRLTEYTEKNGKQTGGARPEQIYNESINKAKGIWQRIVPTMRKIVIGAVLAVAAAAAATAIVHSLPLLGAIGLAKLVVTANIAITAAAAGFFTGYLYDDKIAGFAAKLNPFKKAAKAKGAELEPERSLHASAKGRTAEKEPKQVAVSQKAEHKFTERQQGEGSHTSFVEDEKNRKPQNPLVGRSE